MVRHHPPLDGPHSEEREAELVNGSKVYNVRFYSQSIIQEEDRRKEGKERRK